MSFKDLWKNIEGSSVEADFTQVISSNFVFSFSLQLFSLSTVTSPSHTVIQKRDLNHTSTSDGTV